MLNKTSIFDLNFQQLTNSLVNQGFPPYRAKQIWHGLYKSLWESPKEFTNLPHSLIDYLENTYSFTPLHPIRTLISQDKQTQKVLFQNNKNAPVETVLMLYKKRRTLCISSQSGCPIGCKFCATGQMGFFHNLSPGEIIGQVLYFARLLKQNHDHLTNIVVMGMGEPFLNYESTMAAIDRLNQESGFNFGARRFTISTVGIIPGIEKFTAEKRQSNLAISLHAADDTLRNTLIPINKKYPLKSLIKACKEYITHTHRRITFEWALIEGINDSIDQAEKLSVLLKGLGLVHVNLIPLNPTSGYPQKGSRREIVSKFAEILKENHIPTTIRMRRGIDIKAGCGQLALEQTQAHKKFLLRGNAHD